MTWNEEDLESISINKSALDKRDSVHTDTLDGGGCEAFVQEVDQQGYHIFSRELMSDDDFYPDAVPDIPDVDIGELELGSTIGIILFFCVGDAVVDNIDSCRVELEVEGIDHESRKLFANILTDLPDSLPLVRGMSIELDFVEVVSVHGP